MKKINLLALLLFTLIGYSQPSKVSEENLQKVESIIQNRYILQLKTPIFIKNKNNNFKDAENQAKRIIQELLNKNGFKTQNITQYYFGEFSGFAGNFSQEEINLLKKIDIFVSISKDEIITLDDLNNTNKINATSNSQTIDWGVKRVFQQSNQPFCCPSKPCGKQVAYVLDTGVDLTHSDLTIHSAWSNAFVTFPLPGGNSANDAQGHGTHVAGIIAAKDNGIGTRGVSPGTDIVSVKVLSDWGLGFLSDVIWGCNYVTFMHDFVKSQGVCLQVANLSLGAQGGCNIALKNAVIAMANKGVYVTIAAGNNNLHSNTFSPACTDGQRIFTVASIGQNDIFSSFSNFGIPPVDCAAPGEKILSTYKNGGYANLTGTSMAAPHVAGILLINNGIVNFDILSLCTNDGKKYPIAQICGNKKVREWKSKYYFKNDMESKSEMIKEND